MIKCLLKVGVDCWQGSHQEGTTVFIFLLFSLKFDYVFKIFIFKWSHKTSTHVISSCSAEAIKTSAARCTIVPPGGTDVARPQIRRPLGSLLWDDAADQGARQRAAPAGASGGGGYTKEEIHVLRCVPWRVLLLIMIFCYRAKRTARHLCVGIVIGIVTHTLSLKTNDVAAENNCR